jgi:hypothetical protein
MEKELYQVPPVRKPTVVEEVAARKAARELATQDKKRLRVEKRNQKIKTAVHYIVKAAPYALAFGATVAIFYVGAKELNKESEANYKANKEYARENDNYQPGYNVSDEEVAKANQEFIEDFYKPETIKELKTSILMQYNILIDDITKTEDLAREENVGTILDGNRIHVAIDDLDRYKDVCNADNVDYSKAADGDRVNVAINLNNVKSGVLQARLIEAKEQSKYLSEDSPEYKANQDLISELTGEITSIGKDIATLNDRALELQFEAQADGKTM